VRTRRISAIVLFGVLCWGILTLWAPERWPLSVFQVAVFGLAAAWILLAANGRARLKFHRLLLALAGAVLWGLLQLALGKTVYQWDTWNAVLNWTTNFAIVFVALQSLADSGLRDRFLRAILIFGFLLSILAVTQMLTSGGKVFWLFESGYTHFVLGPFVYKNQYAAFVEALLPLALVAALRDGRHRVAYVCVAATLFASVIASASRAGAILCTAEILLAPALGFARGLISRRTLAQLTVTLAAAGVLFTVVAGWETLWHRLQQADPLVLRGEMLASSLEMIRERPVTGFGLGTWATAYPKYARFDNGTFVNQAHDDWVQWAAEGGIPFLALMLAVVLSIARPAFDSLWGLGLLVVFVHCALDYPMQQRPALAAFFFALCGALAAHGSGRPQRL